MTLAIKMSSSKTGVKFSSHYWGSRRGCRCCRHHTVHRAQRRQYHPHIGSPKQ